LGRAGVVSRAAALGDAEIIEAMTEPITSTHSWADWTTEQIRAAIEAERQNTIDIVQDMLAQCLVRIERKTIPGIVRTMPKLRGPPGVPGAIGPEGPRGRLPMVKAWMAETVYYQGDVVVHRGGCFQARHDTAESPDSDNGEMHWRCLAAAGRDAKSPVVRGTFDANARFAALDMVTLNGGAFIACKNNPGPCPGAGWQLIARQGQRGPAGERGPKGERGERGHDATTIVAWRVDKTNFTATPVLDNGRNGAPLDLRPLFEQFQQEAL
jgi:hypothetical protein